MRIKHGELKIDKKAPFSNCKLGRKHYADVLTDIVKSYAEGFVLAINNEWGAGKTTFVKMWQQQLINDGFRTIYFNAWENDFDNTPLVALVAELKSLNNKSNKSNYKKLLKSAAVIGKNVLPVVAKAAVEKVVGSGGAAEIAKAVTKASTELFESEVDEYISKQNAMAQFRHELTEYVQNQENTNPVVFIVDELDRCRPDYAVEVLEKLKHFFSVPGIVFVLAIDKKQLCSSVQGFYGSDNIDAATYLKRFIDLEYNIPKPDVNQSLDYFYDYYGFSDFLKDRKGLGSSSGKNEGNDFYTYMKYIFKHYGFEMRAQERILGLTRVIVRQFPQGGELLPEVLMTLILIRETRQEDYQRLVENKFSFNEYVDFIEKMIILILPEGAKYPGYDFLMARFIYLYNRREMLRNRRLESDDLVIDFSYSGDSRALQKEYEAIKNGYPPKMDLGYLLRKINLTESLRN